MFHILFYDVACHLKCCQYTAIVPLTIVPYYGLVAHIHTTHATECIILCTPTTGLKWYCVNSRGAPKLNAFVRRNEWHEPSRRFRNRNALVAHTAWIDACELQKPHNMYVTHNKCIRTVFQDRYAIIICTAYCDISTRPTQYYTFV